MMPETQPTPARPPAAPLPAAGLLPSLPAERYRDMVEHMQDGVALLRAESDGDFVFLSMNPAGARITGKNAAEIPGQRLTAAFPGVVDNGLLAVLHTVRAEKRAHLQFIHPYREGERTLWLQSDAVPLADTEILLVFRDATARRTAEESLSLYAKIFAQSGEAIMVTDANNRIVAVNPAFERLTGYTLEDVQGRDPKLLASQRTPRQTYRELWQSLSTTGFWQGELWDRTKSGEVYPKWAAISVIRDESGAVSHYIANFTDISEKKAAEARISHLAHHDALTGLANRHNLGIRLAQSIATARRDHQKLAVLCIDLDRFKSINDTLGHPLGDQLLIEVAQRLRAQIQESDIAARLGGDEFVVVLTGLQYHERGRIADIAENIRSALEQPYRLEDHVLHSSASIGIALFPSDGADADTLLKHADMAMYYAKDRGRNNFQYFTQELNAAARTRLELERGLRRALECGEFRVHYQPQVRTEDGRLAGVEALVRWQQPDGQLVPPQQFIPVAEEIGLIEAIGAWVLDEACRQLAEWRRADPAFAGLRMAVNLSARQLRAEDLVERVAAVLARHGLARDDLELEITESLAMNDPEQAIARLQALRALGVRLAIDDFGTGYSSLVYLKRLPIQALKLDREFVRDIELDDSNTAISIATLALAASLGLEVVAEGVETAAQRDFLLRYHCTYLQGFGIARPMPGADFPAWLENYRTSLLAGDF